MDFNSISKFEKPKTVASQNNLLGSISPLNNIKHHKPERIFSASPHYNQNDQFYHSEILKKRTKIPLAELMQRLAEAKEYLPTLKIMPKRVSDVELQIYELSDLIRHQYVTYSQLQIINGTMKSDIDQLLENTTSQTLRKVIQIIEDKVPFDYLQELMKNKASFEAFKSQEREMIQISADLERLMNRFGLMELDHKRYTNAFEGVTREDVELMLRYKEDKAESDQKMQELQEMIKSLDFKFEVDQKTKEDLFKRMEQSINEIDETTQNKKQDKQQIQDIEDKLNELRQRLNVNEYRMADFNKKINEVQENVHNQLNDLQNSKFNELTNQFDNKFQDYDAKMQQLQNSLQNEMLRLVNQLQNSVEDHNNHTLKQFMSKIDAINKRLTKSEVVCSEIQQENEQLRLFKKRQLDQLSEQFKHLENHVNSKIIGRLSQVEKDMVNGFQECVNRINNLEDEQEQIKGPLIDEYKFIKNESIGIFRELERQQSNYRELISDYVKTLDAKLQEIVRPSKYLSGLETSDEIIKNSTKIKLHKASHEGIVSNQNLIASVINQQMLNSNSLLSLGSSDISNYLKSNKLLQSQQMKRALKNIEQQQQINSTLVIESQQQSILHKPIKDENQGMLLFSSPLSNSSKQPYNQREKANANRSVIIEGANNSKIVSVNISPQSQSQLSIQNRLNIDSENQARLRIRTKSGGHRASTAINKKRNNSSLINSYNPKLIVENRNESDYQFSNSVSNKDQLTTLTKPTTVAKNNFIGNDSSSLNPNTPIGGDYSTLLTNVTQLKKRKQKQNSQSRGFQNLSMRKKKDGARTTLNSSMEMINENEKRVRKVGNLSYLQNMQYENEDHRLRGGQSDANVTSKSGFIPQLKSQLKQNHQDIHSLPTTNQTQVRFNETAANTYYQNNKIQDQNDHIKQDQQIINNHNPNQFETLQNVNAQNQSKQTQLIINLQGSQNLNNQIYENNEQKNIQSTKNTMLQKQLPMTLHRFSHLMKD